MTQSPPLALVADDDEIARKLLVSVLRHEGFLCNSASDGEEASQLLETQTYDLVVTDLRMPHKHGHALSLEVLRKPNRPVLVVHTAVTEPSMTRDLLTRGVDDVLHKPTNYQAAAAKLRFMVDQRSQSQEGGTQNGGTLPQHRGVKSLSESAANSVADSSSDNAHPSQSSDHSETSVAIPGGEGNSNHVSPTPAVNAGETLALPLTNSGLAVYRMALDESTETSVLAREVEHDPGLAVEVLRLSNSSVFNPAGVKTNDIEQAIVRIGRRSLGQLALAFSAFIPFRDSTLSFLNSELSWKRSLATVEAYKYAFLPRRAAHETLDLTLPALVHQLGRFIVAKAYPEEMKAAIDESVQTGRPLRELQLREFGMTESQVLARALSDWKVTEDVVATLNHFDESYEQVAQLPDDLRTGVQQLKHAAWVGSLAVGVWDKADWIEPPPLPVSRGLRAPVAEEHVRKVRSGDFAAVPSRASEHRSSARVFYGCVGDHNLDYINLLLPQLGVTPVKERKDGLRVALINCLGGVPRNLDGYQRYLENCTLHFLCNPEDVPKCEPFGAVFSLPTEVSRLAEWLRTDSFVS